MDQALSQAMGSSDEYLYKIVHSVIQNTNDLQAKILDVGCGQGHLLRTMRKQGFKNLYGCDGFNYFKNSQEFPFEETNLNERLPYADNSFSIVMAIEVIEHLENPRHFVRELVRVLTKDGLLVLSTPNPEALTSLLSLVFRGYFSAFADNCYPAHISPLLSIDAQRVLRENKLNAIKLIWSNRGRVPGSNIYWQNICEPVFHGKYFSDNYFVTARK